jgi:class 3 adenylate cyclase
LAAGVYRLINLSGHALDRLEVEGLPNEAVQTVTVTLTPTGIQLFPATVRPGTIVLKVINDTNDPIIWNLSQRVKLSNGVCIRSITTFRPFLTGKRLLTSQAFRDHFRNETVVPGESFTLRSLTFLFTDLKGSTQLYDRVGDQTAYRLVREHFQILSEIVAAHDGAIVKTIGDAVMATFPTAGSALEASLEMHRRLEEWNLTHHSDDLTLKVGIHEGPCIAVDSNDRLDYFGQTVNMAARIQGLAESKEICLSDTIATAPGAADRLRHLGRMVEQQVVQLKGISEAVAVYRIAGNA